MVRNVVALIAAFSPVVASAQKPVVPPQPCAAIRVSSVENSVAPAGRFSASSVTDLVFTTVLSTAPRGTEVLELRIYGPSGSLYQSLPVPLAAPGKQPDARSVKGLPYPVPERPVRMVHGATPVYEVDVPFPVGGTLIVQRALYGAWRVAPYLNNDKTPCGPAAVFEILP